MIQLRRKRRRYKNVKGSLIKRKLNTVERTTSIKRRFMDFRPFGEDW